MRVWFHCAACLAAGFLLGPITRASIIPVGQGAFPSSATTVDFTGLATDTEVNGLEFDGVQFAYTVGGAPLNGAVEIDEGPGPTNHVSPPNIVSIGDNTGILKITLPSPVNFFGYGFAVLSEDTVADATSISAFSGAMLAGSLSFPGIPDPEFAGGFAGVQSTSKFDRVELTFNSLAPAFALDDVTFASAAVPEPSSIFIAMLGIGVIATLRSKSRR